MQLNNTNGNIILIDRYNKETGRVVYTEYENRIFNDDESIKKEFKIGQNVKMLDIDYSGNPASTLTFEENIEKLFYNTLINEVTDYSLSNDKQNWLYSEKPIRVIIDNTNNVKQSTINEDYKALMDSMIIKHQGFIEVGETNTVMYVDTLIQSEMEVVSDFVDVWIWTENKI